MDYVAILTDVLNSSNALIVKIYGQCFWGRWHTWNFDLLRKMNSRKREYHVRDWNQEMYDCKSSVPYSKKLWRLKDLANKDFMMCSEKTSANWRLFALEIVKIGENLFLLYGNLNAH